MFPHRSFDKKETKTGQWVRSITTAFILVAAAIGLSVPENETEAANPHTTREEVLEERRKDLSDFHHYDHARADSGSGVEVQEVALVTPHYTALGTHTIVLHSSNPQKSDVPSLKS